MSVLPETVTPPSPTAQGCYSATPPPGSFAAGYCNFDQADAQIAVALIVLAVIFILIALALVVWGLYGAFTAHELLPRGIANLLPMTPADDRDRRLRGAGVAAAGVAALMMSVALLLLGSERVLLSAWPSVVVLMLELSGLAFLALSGILNMSAKYVNRRDGTIRSGWDRLSSSFRSARF